MNNNNMILIIIVVMMVVTFNLRQALVQVLCMQTHLFFEKVVILLVARNRNPTLGSSFCPRILPHALIKIP